MISSLKTSRLIGASICAFILLGVGAAHGASLPPTYSNVPYGPHQRDALDFWKASSGKPTALVIYIHGGGFYAGDKGAADDADIEKCLAAGVSFASISYPYYQDVPLDGILRDNIARAVQFLRSKAAEWNIDKARVAVFGESAGAGSSLWLAFHDDLADPASADPVLRESTRVTVAGAINTQATYDLTLWDKLFEKDMDKQTLRAWDMIMARTELDMYHAKNEKELKSKKYEPVRRDLDMLSMMDKDDPPVILQTLASQLRKGDILHHTRHPKAVKERCDELGMACLLVLDETPEEKRVGVVDFMIDHLK